jgi:hypothetical protein
MGNLNLIKNMDLGHLHGLVEILIQDNITEMKETAKE